MGKIKMVRIDYRMVHGQIVAKWIKSRPVDRLILADDALVDDPFMGDIYRMAVPDKEVDIVKLQDTGSAIEQTDDTIMLIFKDVDSAYLAFEKAVVQGVALSVEEFEKLSKMKAAGIQVYVQPIPENAPVSLETIEKKLK